MKSESKMRMMGFGMLICGFAWLVDMQLMLAIRGAIRPILRAQYQKVEQGGRSSVPTEEVVKLVSETAKLAFDAHPLFILPATLMLVGAICLAWRPRAESKGIEGD
jgi:hypothetical protein